MSTTTPLFQYRPSARCSACHRRSVNRCCGSCGITAYCSDDCAQSDWNEWHHLTCPHLRRLASQCPCKYRSDTPELRDRYALVFLQWARESEAAPESTEEKALPEQNDVKAVRNGAIVEAAEAIKEMKSGDARSALQEAVTTDTAVQEVIEGAEQAIAPPSQPIAGALDWVKGRFRKYYQGCDINPPKKEKKCLKDGGTKEECAEQRKLDDEECKKQRKKAMVRGGTAFSGSSVR